MKILMFFANSSNVVNKHIFSLPTACSSAAEEAQLELAQTAGLTSGRTPGACKICGTVGHLTYQCRNNMKIDHQHKKDEMKPLVDLSDDPDSDEEVAGASRPAGDRGRERSRDRDRKKKKRTRSSKSRDRAAHKKEKKKDDRRKKKKEAVEMPPRRYSWESTEDSDSRR